MEWSAAVIEVKGRIIFHTKKHFVESCINELRISVRPCVSGADVNIADIKKKTKWTLD
jgi:hypothetical protein